ncbi:hypothetical protein Tco_1174429 [Tanacetum coccineum]
MALILKNQGGWKLAQIKKLTDEELKEKFEYLMRSMERFVPMDTEKESRNRIGVSFKTESSQEAKVWTQGKDVSKKLESTKSGTEEDVEAYMEERVDEPSSEEFPMSSIPQGPAPAKIATHIYMLTEVKYPLPPRVCKAMLEKKLLGDRKDEKLVVHPSEDQVRGGLLGIIVNRLKSGSYRVKSGRHSLSFRTKVQSGSTIVSTSLV